MVRGARQVGKTYSVRAFGARAFEQTVAVNFEERPELAQCFSDVDPRAIVDRLSVLTRASIRPGKTLLFLDEIQECPQAIMALRYFYENMPDLHVVGAGSLVEFAVRSEDFRMPVGRVASVFMKPMTYEEFLHAIGEGLLCEALGMATPVKGVEPAYRQRLETLLRLYLLVGGMPAAVNAYVDQVPMEEIQRLQTALVRSYGDDFSKYATVAKHKYLKDVYASAPRMAGQRYKYSQVNPDVESKFLKDALELLRQARCVTKVCHASGAGVPLHASLNERKFKILCLDVGLMQNALGVQASIFMDTSVMQTHSGRIAEQLVGQEWLAYGDPYADPQLYFWTREAKGSNAEVDYLIEINGRVVPVEVKSGATGSLKSMRLFLDSYPSSPVGIRYSMHDLSYVDNILSIPLYMINQTKRLYEQVA